MFVDGETEGRKDGVNGSRGPVLPSLRPSVPPSPSGAARGADIRLSQLRGAGAGPGAIAAVELVPAELLDGGEIIIFAVKPSLWFVALKSSRWLLGMLLTVLLVHWVGETAVGIPEATIIRVAVAVAGVRVGLALLQWVSRLYILTNRRIMRLTGIFNIDLFECQLTRIQSTVLTIAWYERVFGVGTISFATAGAGGGIEASWTHVNQPLELHERVRAAIHRAQRPNNGL
jgi:hypothetical protein